MRDQRSDGRRPDEWSTRKVGRTAEDARPEASILSAWWLPPAYLRELLRDFAAPAFLPAVRDVVLLARAPPDFAEAVLLARGAPDFADTALLPRVADLAAVVLRAPARALPDLSPVNLPATFLALFVTLLLAPLIARVTFEMVVLLLAIM